MRQHRLVSSDGTELAWYESGPVGAPAVVICNGLGGGTRVWRSVVEPLTDHYRVLSWDYRGLYQSAPSQTPGAYDVACHAKDLAELITHAEASEPILMGWSMGVQVALELHRHHPDLARGLVAVHGAAGQPVKSAFDSSTLWTISPGLFAGMRALGSRLEPVAGRLARSSVVAGAFVEIAKRVGVMSPRIDFAAFQDLADEWLRLDLAVYAEIFEHLDAHDARDLLPSIATPTLVIAGGRDRMTPAHLSHELVQEMPNARLAVVESATHFGLIEAPDEISRFVRDFMAELDCRETPSQRIPS